MKKFLSLVLALVMTMSLVTISAGATEYKDLTDKDEIQYEEAVAVLNRIGIITGYEDGTFRPETELTRGAAAKIIVSLLIGPDAANALPNTASPYPDVPAGHTFAGVIGFCKTSEIISGYGDGTFKPANSLTGYAFAKMLLGALGYKSDVEGFTGTGWTMNVARVGNAAELFNRLNFDGSAAVNREEACQLALNTLKATMVEYTGGVNINTASGDTMTVNPTRTYVISNQDYAKNISNRKASQAGNAVSDNHYTVEFGEEHFKDLRLDNEHQGKLDDFGRPSNVWSFKKVTIGTFPIEPDFTYTTQVAHNVAGTTDASKVRALGLNGYETTGEVDGKNASTILTINGLDGDDADVKDISTVTGGINKVADIADLTDNGTLVEVYVSEDDADFICNVVVVKTQLMEIKRIGSDYVALDTVDADDPAFGYNDKPIDEKLEDVEVDDNYYNTLHEMKAGDLVAVVPLTTDGGATWTVGKAYAPEEAKGSLTRVDTYGDTNNDRKAISVTVGGTEYKIAQWNKDLTGIDGDSIRVTKKDVTLILDEYGNALQAKDVGDTSNWMVVKNYRQSLVNGSIVNIVNGWDIGGDTLSLNVGNIDYTRATNGDIQPGDLVYYTNNTNSNTAEWRLYKDNERGVFDIDAEANGVGTNTYEIKASNTSIALDGYAEMPLTTGTSDRVVIDTGIKFIYVSFDEDGEVDNIEFVNGVKDTKNEEILGGDKSAALNKNAQACVSLKDHKASGQKDKVTDDSAVKAVVIKRESSDASIGNLLYISNYHGSATKYDNDNRPVYGYEAIMMGSDGKVADEKAIVYSYKNLRIGEFARYTKVTAPEGVTGVDDNFYDLRGYGIDSNKDTWGRSAAIAATQLVRCLSQDKRLVMTSGVYGNTRAIDLPDLAQDWNDKDSLNLGDTSAANLINTRGSSWVDLRNVKDRIEDIDDLKDWLKDNPGKAVNVALLFNDNIDSNDFRHAYLIVVTGTGDAPETPVTIADVKWTGTAAAADYTVTGPTSGVYTVTPATGKTIEIAAGTGYTAAKQTDGSWKVTITASSGTVNVEVNDATTSAAIDVEITLNADDVKAGVKVTEAHIITSSDDVSSGKYNGMHVGDLYLTVSKPSGVTLIGDGTVNLTGTKNGMTVTTAAGSNWVQATQIAKIGAAEMAKLDTTQTMTLTKLTSAVSHEVVVKSDVSGLTFSGTSTVAEAGGVLNLTVASGLPKHATEVKVYFTVDGLTDDSTLASTLDATTGYQTMTVTANNGVGAQMNIATGTNAKADPSETNVTITIKSVLVSKVKAELKGASLTSAAATALEIPCDGSEWTLPNLTLSPAPNTTTISKIGANVKLEGVTPVTSGDLSIDYDDTAVAAASGDITVGTHKYTCDGKTPVTITVTPDVTELKVGAIVLAGTNVDSVVPGAAIAVKDGANDAPITLTVSKAAFLGNNKVIKVNVVSGATGAKTFESAATAATGNVDTAAVSIAKGELTGITGAEIIVTVEIADAT